MESEADTMKQSGAEFMLKEYERIYLLRMSEDQQAEQRVNFFLVIATAAVGAMIFLLQASDVAFGALFAASASVLIGLLLFGLVTLNRLATRTLQLIAYNKVLNRIRIYFADRDPEIASYLSFYEKILREQTDKSRFRSRRTSRLRGSLVDLMILANSLICGGIVSIGLSMANYSIEEIVI